METLDLVVENLDALPEPIRPLYAEKDGKFRLKINGVEDSENLVKSLKEANREAAATRKALEGWKQLGKSPDEIAELLKEREAKEHQEAEKKGEWEKLKAQMNDKHASDLKAKDEQVAKMRQTLERYLIDAAATDAIAQAKGVPKLLLPHVRSSVQVVEEDGNYSVRVVDDKGDPRVNGKGDPLTIADLVTEMRGSEVFGRAFEGSGKSGSGAPPTSGNGAGRPGGDDLSKLPPMERLRLARERGQTQART